MVAEEHGRLTGVLQAVEPLDGGGDLGQHHLLTELRDEPEPLMAALVLLRAEKLHGGLEAALDARVDGERQALDALGRKLIEHLDLDPPDHVRTQEQVQLLGVRGAVVGADMLHAEALGLEIDAGTALVFTGERNIEWGIDRVVATFGKMATWLIALLAIVIVTDVVLRRWFVIGSTQLQELEN